MVFTKTRPRSHPLGCRAPSPLCASGLRGLPLLQPASRPRCRPPNFQTRHARVHLGAQGGRTTFWNLRKPRGDARRAGGGSAPHPVPPRRQPRVPGRPPRSSLQQRLCVGVSPPAPAPRSLNPTRKPRAAPSLRPPGGWGRGRGHLRTGARPVTCPRAPEPRASSASARRAPLLHARRRPGLRSAQDARDPDVLRRLPALHAPPPGVRAGAESRLGPRGASYPRARRRQADPEGSAPGFN